MKFAVNVAVTNPETGEASWFYRGQEVPDWAKKDGVCGDHCFADDDEVVDSTSNEDLDSLSVKNLQKVAADEGIDLVSSKKSEIIDEIIAARAQAEVDRFNVPTNPAENTGE